MFVRGLRVKFLEDVTIEVTFQDGKVFEYDMSTMFSKYPQLEELRRNRSLFESGYVDKGGYAVIWNDDLDFSCDSIYECGEYVRTDEVPYYHQIGSLLTRVREEMNITQFQLAKLSHIDQADISKIERGNGNPTIRKINRLFNALGKKIELVVK